MDFDIKIRDGTFQVGFFDKRDSFLLSIIKMPDKSRNVSFNILTIYSAIGGESLRITRASIEAATGGVL